MANTFKFGNKNWAWKEGSVLAYNDENNNFKPLPFDFTRSSSATRVNKDGLIEVVESDEPRVDYLNNADGHLLLEPSRSNLATYSEQFDDASWTKFASTITANSVISPDGSQNADFIVPDASSSVHSIYRTISMSAGTKSLSVFLKAGNYSKFRLYFYDGVDVFEIYGDCATGLINSTNATATVEEFPNGWYRFTISSPNAAFSVGNYTLRLTDDNYQDSWTANGTDGLYVWGWQFEEGSYATSYIPTSGSSVTRAVDAASQTPPSGIIGQTEGTLFLDFVPLNDPESGIGKWMFFLGNGTAYITILLSSNGKIRGNVSNTTSQCAIDTTYDWQKGVRYKAALAYKENDFAMYVNGSLIGTDVLGTIPSTSLITTQYNTTPANANNYLLNNAVLYNTRLSNAELAQLTS